MFNTYLTKNFNVLPKDKQADIETIRNQKRYIPFSERPTHFKGGARVYSHLHIDNLLMSQGVKDCLTWRGIALGKSVYDFALIPMIIWENRPATILEIGSGEGASAIWMADICKSYNLSTYYATHVYSMDIDPPDIPYDGVTFLQGDSKEITTIFDVENLPHPWLVIEDAHINVNEIIKYFESHMHTGDYMIIEDSWGRKGSTLQVPPELKVDAYYCDYFGRNACGAMNTILRKE